MNAQNKEKNFRLCRWKVEKVRCSFFWDIFQVLPVTLRSLSCWKLTLLCHDSASSSLALLASSSRVILALYSANSAACGVERQKKKNVSKKPKNLHTSMTSIIRTRCHFMNGWTHKKKKNQTTTTGIHYFIWVALTFIIHLSTISFKYFTAFVKTLVKPFQALKQCV